MASLLRWGEAGPLPSASSTSAPASASTTAASVPLSVSNYYVTGTHVHIAALGSAASGTLHHAAVPQPGISTSDPHASAIIPVPAIKPLQPAGLPLAFREVLDVSAHYRYTDMHCTLLCSRHLPLRAALPHPPFSATRLRHIHRARHMRSSLHSHTAVIDSCALAVCSFCAFLCGS